MAHGQESATFRDVSEFAYGKQLMYYLKGLEPFAANCCTLQRFNKRKTETKNIANAYYDTKSIKW